MEERGTRTHYLEGNSGATKRLREVSGSSNAGQKTKKTEKQLNIRVHTLRYQGTRGVWDERVVGKINGNEMPSWLGLSVGEEKGKREKCTFFLFH